MPPLAVVALISGGKDSLFSIIHCIANGHHVVALANLHPALHPDQEAVDDLDSYMYQTIGHTVIPLYAEALGLPLYRQEIAGTAVNQSQSYGPAGEHVDGNQDETESLLPLLRKVKDAHPEVNAVSTGAILSDYQRTRVESVALRLGLTPLSFLWQWPSLPSQSEASLLEDMASLGQDARIIKVASGGLDDSFLWQNVAEPRTISRLAIAAQRFGSQGDGALLGEGGEYETMAIDGPSYLWKARIEIEERQVLQGEAGSSSLRLLWPRVVPKTSGDATESSSLRKPPLWDKRVEGMLQELEHSPEVSVKHQSDHLIPMASFKEPIISFDGDMVFLPGLTGFGDSASSQIYAILEEATKSLDEHGHSIDDIAYTSIIMRDMAEFPAINTVYGRFFTKANPPARVTVACADVLPPSAQLAVALTSVRSKPRKGLHVQSQSYWAPANIGPYSQAITVSMGSLNGPTMSDNSIVFIAGQIPLIPPSMELAFPTTEGTSAVSNIHRQSALALQHLDRIGHATKVERWAAVIAFVVTSDQDLETIASGARRLWTAYHESNTEDTPKENDDEDKDFDVWHATNRPTWDRIQSAATTSRLASLEPKHAGVPPIYVVRIDALPRGASIEWVGYGLIGGGADSRPKILPLQHLLQTFHRHNRSCVRDRQ